MIAAELDLERPLIFELPAVFTAAECADWIARIQSAGTELATINTKRGSQVDSQIRNNRRVIFDDHEWANTLFERVKDQVPQTIHDMSVAGVNERLRCYEYQPGHRFAPHSDGAFIRDEGERSWYTYMVYLNEGFEGGETLFFVEPEVVIKDRFHEVISIAQPRQVVGAHVAVCSRTQIRVCGGPVDESAIAGLDQLERPQRGDETAHATLAAAAGDTQRLHGVTPCCDVREDVELERCAHRDDAQPLDIDLLDQVEWSWRLGVVSWHGEGAYLRSSSRS